MSESDGDCDSDVSVPGPSSNAPCKKAKRMCKFREDWKQTFKWLTNAESQFSARCKTCNKDFSISHGGLSDVKHHDKGKEHNKNLASGIKNQVMTNFFTKPNTAEYDKITFAELTLTFHCVKHNLSYNSQDCTNKLLQHIVTDSQITKKISCGKTKSEAIVKDVLAPLAEKDVLDCLKPKDDKPLFFSVMTDTSNKGNRKMYPICIQYFTLENGCQNKLLDFFECSAETSDAISNNILQTLERLGLDIKNVVSFSADNTNANFGKHRSAYTLLRDKNPSLLKAGCLAHVLSNTFKFALNKLNYDVEGVVLKIYSHFQASSLRREDLKEFVEYAQLHWVELVKHVPTRWLSLGPAIDKVLLVYPALMSYFLASSDSCSKSLQNLLFLDDFGEEQMPNTEFSKMALYLHFCANVCALFEKSNKLLQKNDTASTELFGIMKTLLEQINIRIDEKFFGAHFRKAKNHACKDVIDQVTADFIGFYVNIKAYLESHFDFSSENPFKVIEPLSLKKAISFEELMKAVDTLGLSTTICENNLFDNYTLVKPSLEVVVDSKESTVQQKWCTIFKDARLKHADLSELRIVVSCALSIPPSNAMVERVFSQMGMKWSKVRNRCLVDLIRSELLISLNLDMTCAEFALKYRNDKKLIAATQSQKKYEWRR